MNVKEYKRLGARTPAAPRTALPGAGARPGWHHQGMSVVKINAITVPADSGDELARRFAARAGAVDSAEGFEGFELLKPADDRTTWLVVTRWRDGSRSRRGSAPPPSPTATAPPPNAPAATPRPRSAPTASCGPTR